MLVPSTPLFTLLHRLIPVAVPSTKISLRGRVFKESVKVCTPKSPSFSYDFAPDFATFYVLPHRFGAQTQDFRRFAEREKPVFEPPGRRSRSISVHDASLVLRYSLCNQCLKRLEFLITKHAKVIVRLLQRLAGFRFLQHRAE